MAAALRRASGVVVPQPLPWHRRLVAFLAVSLLRLCLSSWRCRWIAATDNPDERRNVIYCVWHNQLPLAGLVRCSSGDKSDFRQRMGT